jgi:hypothetical protein
LNYLGQKLGEREFETGTSEYEIEAILSEYAQPPIVPPIKDVTPRQIRQALILSGVTMESIDAAFNGFPEPTRSLARAEWEYSVAFERHRPLVSQVAALLGWSDEQLDNLWKFAASL